MGNYSNIKYNCASNGTGIRTAIYLSGCTLHCKGCFNPEQWDFAVGSELTDDVIQDVLSSLEPDSIQGLSILGGEPLDGCNIESCQRLVDAVKFRFGDSKDIWIWSGHTLRELKKNPEICKVLSKTDVLVDGPFLEDKADMHLKFRGSRNQRILLLKTGDELC